MVPSVPRHVVGLVVDVEEITGAEGSSSVKGPTVAEVQLAAFVTLTEV